MVRNREGCGRGVSAGEAVVERDQGERVGVVFWLGFVLAPMRLMWWVQETREAGERERERERESKRYGVDEMDEK